MKIMLFAPMCQLNKHMIDLVTLLIFKMSLVQTRFKTMYLVSRKPDVDAHSNNPPIPPTDITPESQPGPSSYMCPHCSISFMTNEELQEHIRTIHAKSILHECTKCNYKTANLLEYKEHFAAQHETKRKRSLSEEKASRG